MILYYHKEITMAYHTDKPYESGLYFLCILFYKQQLIAARNISNLLFSLFEIYINQRILKIPNRKSKLYFVFIAINALYVIGRNHATIRTIE